MKKIGFIGLGLMGFEMVKNLLAKGCDVKIYDVVPEAVERLIPFGAIAAHSISEVAHDVDVVITMVQTGDQVKACCIGSDGIFNQLKTNNGLFINTSSIDVESTAQLHAAAHDVGVVMLDAPVSGGVLGASAGTLTFMVGGSQSAFEIAKPILIKMGEKIVYAGGPGCGIAAKICNNMILGVSMIAVSEAFVLAQKLGLSAEKLFEISGHSSGQCWSLTQYCPWPHILPKVPSSHGYQPGFSAKMMLKDLGLSQTAAADVAISTPLGKHATDLYQTFVDQQSGDIDFSAIIQMLLHQKIA